MHRITEGNLNIHKFDDNPDTAIVSFEAMHYLMTTENPPPLIFVGLEVVAHMHCEKNEVYLFSRNRIFMESRVRITSA